MVVTPAYLVLDAPMWPRQRGLLRLACALLLVTLAGAAVRPRPRFIIPLTDSRFEWTRARLLTAGFPVPPQLAKANGPEWDELLTASSTQYQPKTAPAALNEEPSPQAQLSEGVDELKAKLAHLEKSQALREASETRGSCWHSDFTDDKEDLEHKVTQHEARSKKLETKRITTRKQAIKTAYVATDEDACADSPDPKGCAKAHQQIKWRSLQDKYECAAYTDIVNKDHTKDKNSDADHAGLPSRSRSPFLIPDDDS
jgi:hypothetical protein